MRLTTGDWAIIVGYFAFTLLVGVFYSRRAGRSLGDFFLSGRQLPWWLAGTSMVATTFSADTPLAVSGLVAKNGVAGNWIWWNQALGGMLTVFFFARLWRRAGILTDMELAELRYSGKPAAVLRGLRSLYLGFPINCLIIGWVNLAMAKILSVTLGWDRLDAVFVSLALTAGYSALSGLWGVVVTDLVQFVLAMIGCIALAVIGLQQPAVGGLAGLGQHLAPGALDFLPHVGAGSGAQTLALPVVTFIAYVGVQWWASWYPGAEPGGGGYIAQRMMSSRDEKHAALATLWFTIAHYCLRPWPWILVGLVSAVLYPGLADPELGYVLVIRDHLPAIWRGLLLAAFFAAYMSTISTQLNWGASYVVNDVYRRFWRPAAAERELVWVSRGVTLLTMLVSVAVTLSLTSIKGTWEFILESGAGVGLVLILRWYWWRVNAWSEIAALVTPMVGFLALRLFTELAFPHTLLLLAGATAVVWLLVTLLTRPEAEEHLIAFYRRVRPGGPGWRRIAARAGLPPPEPIAPLVRDWAAGWVLVYAGLLGVGKLLLSTVAAALPFFGVALVAGAVIYRDLARRGWGTLTG